MFQETLLRSLVKALTWHALISCAAFVIAFSITGRADFAVLVSASELFLGVLFYLGHERIWNLVSFGKFGREKTKLPEGFVLWFTGLPCSGKSTLAERFAKELQQSGVDVEHLDGDAVRSVVQNSAFGRDGRNANVRQMGFLAARLAKHKVGVIASFVSPYRESRDFNRSICPNFIEVYISTPLEECERRDVKGMYKRAREGEIRNFTGLDDPYEPPINPELQIDTTNRSIEDCLTEIRSYLTRRNFLPSQSRRGKPEAKLNQALAESNPKVELA